MKEYSSEELILLYQSVRDTDQNKWFVPQDHRPFFWGEERTFQEMKAIKEESLLYIEQILKNIDTFLKTKAYLK